MQTTQTELIQKLSSRIRRMEKSRLDHFHKSREGLVSTGIKRLDSFLPNKGLLRGTLTEWIAADSGCGAMTLAMLAMIGAQHTPASEDEIAHEDHPAKSTKRPTKKSSRKKSRKTSTNKRRGNPTAEHETRPRVQPVIIIDPQRSFYLPAAVSQGLNARHTILIRPQSVDDAMWALEQALRHTGPAAVLCRIEREGRQWNDQVFRRLQLACETGNSLGLLIRPDSARRQTCWAEVRFRVTSVPSQPKPIGNYLPIATTDGTNENQTPHVQKTLSIIPADETRAGPLQVSPGHIDQCDQSDPIAQEFIETISENVLPSALEQLSNRPGEPIRPFARRINIELVSAKGRMTPQMVPLEICDATGCVRVAAKLRHAAVSERTRRISQPALRAV